MNDAVHRHHQGMMSADPEVRDAYVAKKKKTRNDSYAKRKAEKAAEAEANNVRNNAVNQLAAMGQKLSGDIAANVAGMGEKLGGNIVAVANNHPPPQPQQPAQEAEGRDVEEEKEEPEPQVEEGGTRRRSTAAGTKRAVSPIIVTGECGRWRRKPSRLTSTRTLR